ncbi:hypothetical protein R3W88_021122 [Solanum pinnatisectum]|uniref:Acylsugar acyltransferase 3 n=1 Tax=Solanum pinnatisectum TaxID=50273 RepID=A0AAV9LUE7_9SOLN|nr:hypothetical protein R3W88_021122 [Solanum pinnatisectum]
MAASSCVSLAEKIIKPDSPTPSSLRRYNLSLMDQIMVLVYMPIVAFYPFLTSKTPQQVSNILENSLSKVLSSYYPFAGTLRDNNTFVDCNDRGAKFMNVRYDCPMSEIVNLPDTGPEYLPFAKGMPWGSTPDDESLLVVQLSHFNCGGLAISVRLSHKIADGCTLCNFISDWASIARDDENANIPSPEMIGSSIFPPSTEMPPTGFHMDTEVDYEFYNLPVSKKRYLFSSSKLEMLKSQVTSETGVQNPSRLEVLFALIYKCAARAARSFKRSSLSIPVNLRPILDPPLATRTIGNILSFIKVETMSEDEMTIGRIVGEIRKAKDEVRKEGHVKEEKLVSLWTEWIYSMGKEFEFYRYSSVCNYPLNNLDFGWGKPSRVTIPVYGTANTCMFMDNLSGDGIEVIIVLPEKVVTQFENSKDLIHFASPVNLSARESIKR